MSFFAGKSETLEGINVFIKCAKCFQKYDNFKVSNNSNNDQQKIMLLLYLVKKNSPRYVSVTLISF